MLTIQKLKPFKGKSGIGFNLELYLDGEKIATVLHDGGSECFDYYFVNPAAATTFVGIVNAMPIAATIDMAIIKLIKDHTMTEAA